MDFWYSSEPPPDFMGPPTRRPGAPNEGEKPGPYDDILLQMQQAVFNFYRKLKYKEMSDQSLAIMLQWWWDNGLSALNEKLYSKYGEIISLSRDIRPLDTKIRIQISAIQEHSRGNLNPKVRLLPVSPLAVKAQESKIPAERELRFLKRIGAQRKFQNVSDEERIQDLENRAELEHKKLVPREKGSQVAKGRPKRRRPTEPRRENHPRFAHNDSGGSHSTHGTKGSSGGSHTTHAKPRKARANDNYRQQDQTHQDSSVNVQQNGPGTRQKLSALAKSGGIHSTHNQSRADRGVNLPAITMNINKFADSDDDSNLQRKQKKRKERRPTGRRDSSQPQVRGNEASDSSEKFMPNQDLTGQQNIPNRHFQIERHENENERTVGLEKGAFQMQDKAKRRGKKRPSGTNEDTTRRNNQLDSEVAAQEIYEDEELMNVFGNIQIGRHIKKYDQS